MSFPSLGASLPFGSFSGSFPSHRPCDPYLAPPGWAPLRRRRTDPVSSSEPPCPLPQASRVSPGSPTFPDRPDLRTRCPLSRPPCSVLSWVCKIPTPFKSAPGHGFSRDAPAMRDPGSPGPHLSPLEALPLRRLHPRADPTSAQHLWQGVGYLLHGASHPVHVAQRSRVRGPRQPRDPHCAARPALPTGIRR